VTVDGREQAQPTRDLVPTGAVLKDAVVVLRATPCHATPCHAVSTLVAVVAYNAPRSTQEAGQGGDQFLDGIGETDLIAR
jgi:hypothetical protein